MLRVCRNELYGFSEFLFRYPKIIIMLKRNPKMRGGKKIN